MSALGIGEALLRLSAPGHQRLEQAAVLTDEETALEEDDDDSLDFGMM